MGLFKSKKNIKEEDTDDVKEPTRKYVNPMHNFSSCSNLELAKIFAREHIVVTFERMENFGKDRWFTSSDPEVIALRQLQMGPKYITTNGAFTNAIAYILELEKAPKVEEIENNWQSYYTDVKEKVGERAKKIIKEPSKEELEKMLEDICKIDLG